MTGSAERPARTAPEVFANDLVLPHQTNNFGTMFGGEVLAMMDRIGAIAALRFCRAPVVTASSERIDFRTPIPAGAIVEAAARVIFVGRTSMIVRVHLYAEHALAGTRELCTTGYFSFVTVRIAAERPVVPQLLVEDDLARAESRVGEEIRRAIDARRTP